jgi:predicted restriction endonuclease
MEQHKVTCIPNIESVLPLFVYKENTLIEITGQCKPQFIYGLSFAEGLLNENATGKHNFNTQSLNIFSKINEKEIKEEVEANRVIDDSDINKALLDIMKKSLSENPSLKEGLEKRDYKSKRLPRSIAFSIAIKRLYNYSCAICGSSLKTPKGKVEVHSAHIYPKKLNGSDDVRNGVCLCRMHHWAFDVGWIAISNDYTIMVRKDLPSLDEYLFMKSFAGSIIRLPEKKEFAPHTLFLFENRKLMGFR